MRDLIHKLPRALAGDAFAAKGVLVSLLLCLPGYLRFENFVSYGKAAPARPPLASPHILLILAFC